MKLIKGLDEKRKRRREEMLKIKIMKVKKWKEVEKGKREEKGKHMNR